MIFRYYSGEKKAPVLTLVIGGNHEASNHMQELPYGGWLAPNIYYFGKYAQLDRMVHSYIFDFFSEELNFLWAHINQIK